MEMEIELNVGNSIFPELNNSEGILLCGYEWGWSKSDQADEEAGLITEVDESADISFTFSNKSPVYGDKAFIWKYDNRIIYWFELWMHPLNRENLGDDFDKCILQTNWCNTQANKIKEKYYTKLTNSEQIDNFISHICRFKPRLILFFGSELIKALQDHRVLPKFKECMGDDVSSINRVMKDFSGKQFYITFQDFEKCKVVCLPHPSGTRGLSDDYIQLFSAEISSLIQEVKDLKGIK